MSASRGKLLQTVIVPIAALVGLAMVVVVGFVWYSAKTQDDIALEKSIAAVGTALQRRHAQMGANNADYGWWNDAVVNLDVALNEEWADINVGAYQFETYGIDLSLVVDRSNETTFARLDGEPAAIDAFEVLPGSLDVVLAQARDTDVIEPETALGVLLFRDGLALVAATIVTPYEPEEIDMPEGRAVLVFAQQITQEMLDDIAKPLPLSELRMLPPDAEVASEATAPVVSPAGELLAQLVWVPNQPGREFLRSVTPSLAAAIVVLIVFTAAVLRHAREATSEIEASEARFRDVADASSDWIWEVDTSLRFTFLSDRVALITGRTPEASLGLPLAELFHPGEADDRWQQHVDDLANWRPFRNVLSLSEDAEGIHRTVRLAGKPTFDRAGRPTGFRGTATDITAEMVASRRAKYLALHDPLTDLPNRELLGERLEQAISGVGRRRDMAALLLIDIDHFKDINDTLGHPTGDALLKEVAVRCAACVREVDTVARIGGDEFAIVQIGIKEPADVQLLARRLLELFQQPFEINGHEVLATISIGVALIPSDSSVPDKLLQLADIALYRAKEDGRNAVRFFEPEMDARLQRRRELERDLRLALARDELELYYQPKVSLLNDELSGVEALVRWNHPKKGLVPPGEFIGVAEETGLILQLGEWVLRTACRQAVAWPGLQMAVNISPVQFRRSDLIEVIKSALDETGLPPHRLEIEITESVLIQQTEVAAKLLKELKQMGVRIAMDDFGTGYSSLSYLHRFAFDKIKVDRSFIQSLGVEPAAAAIVRTVIGLASSLHMLSCAEGVETKEQLTRLRGEGCDEVQGFLFGRPVPAKEFARQFGMAGEGSGSRRIDERSLLPT